MESILHEDCSFFLAKKSDTRSSFLALEKHNFGQNLGMESGIKLQRKLDDNFLGLLRSSQ